MMQSQTQQQNYERAAAAVPNGRRRFDRILTAAPTSTAAMALAPKPSQSLQTRLRNAKDKQQTAEILMDAGRKNDPQLKTLTGKFDLSGVNFSMQAHLTKYLPMDKVSSLNGANLTGANLQNKNMHGVPMQGAVLAGANCTGTNFGGCDLRDMKANGASFARANMDGATTTNAQMTNCRLDGASMLNNKGAQLNLDGSFGSDFRISGDNPNATMRGASFTNASFAGNFAGADVSGMKLTDPKGGLDALKVARPATVAPKISYSNIASTLSAPVRPLMAAANAMKPWAGLIAAPGFV